VVGGQLQEGLFSPAEEVEVRSWLRAKEKESTEPKTPKAIDPSTAGCDVVVVTSAGAEAMEPEKALAEARLGVLGTVTAIEQGLFRGRIASIVTVQVDRWMKAPVELARPLTISFLREEGDLTVSDTTYCRRGTRKDRLSVGRRVFLASSTILQEEPLLLLPYDRQLFFETAKQGISAPSPDAAQALGSWVDFEARLQRLRGGQR
jgi:hypothetical protein